MGKPCIYAGFFVSRAHDHNPHAQFGVHVRHSVNMVVAHSHVPQGDSTKFDSLFDTQNMTTPILLSTAYTIRDVYQHASDGL